MSYRSRLSGIALIFAFMCRAASGIQIGPEIRVGGGEATVGGLGVKDGKAVAPTAGQVLDSVINSTPLALASDADKANIKAAIVTVGYVSAVVADPITGLVIISVLSGSNGQRHDIPVPVRNAPPTGKSWNLTAKCLVQQEAGLITAMFDNDPPGIMDVGDGDTLVLSAGYCQEYKDKSITAVTVKETGKSHAPDAKPPAYRHYLVGRTTN